MTEFTLYRKNATVPMRPYIPGESLNKISLSDVDVPREGGMVARDPNNHDDQWYISPGYFTENYESAEPEEEQPARSVDVSFSTALEHVRAGGKAVRTGWNGKDMFIFLVPGSRFEVNRHPLLGIYPEGTVINYRSHVDMRTATGEIVPWLCSQSDLLADDWTLF